MSILAVFMVWFLCYSVIAVHLFGGSMAHICVVANATGLEMIPEQRCNSDLYGKDVGFPNGFRCPLGFQCHKVGNPAQGWVSFDNVPAAFFTIFQSTTLEGWTPTMYANQEGYGRLAWIFHVSMILLFSFCLLNLFIAAITVSFSKVRADEDAAMTMEIEDMQKIASGTGEVVASLAITLFLPACDFVDLVGSPAVWLTARLSTLCLRAPPGGIGSR